jgi:hypothetical protein
MWKEREGSLSILPLSQYITRNHLWFKDQGMYLIFSLDTSITVSMYMCLERAEHALYYGT